MQEEQLSERNQPLLVSAVLKTMAYADVFQFPLRASEIFFYLISFSCFPLAAVERTLSSLVREGVIGYTDGFYFLKGRENLVLIRRRRESASKGKWQKALSWARFFRLCPWIKLVGVSGALAMDNSEADDDLDLVFITSRKRVWLTRALVALFLVLTGQYRRPGKISGRFCPNLFLAEEALDAFEQNLFIAHEIVQLRLLWERDDFYVKFRLQNAWVKNFLPHALATGGVANKEGRRRPSPAPFFDLLEKIVKWLQIKFMERKITKEIVTDGVLRFHPRDTTKLVLTLYEERLKQLGLSGQGFESRPAPEGTSPIEAGV